MLSPTEGGGVSEHDQQVAVVEWCEAQGIPVFAIPNGGLRHKHTAAMLRAEGVRPGVPDLFVPVPKGDYAGLFVEMKDVNGRKPRQSQMEWLDLLNANGYAAYWARGADEAIRLLERYMAL